jgi:hypothetical protein
MNKLMTELGYEPNKSFNAIHGDQRLYYLDLANERHVDVFVDTFSMCHTLRLNNRISLISATLTPSDLLITKLQVVELNRKDLLDLLALLHDHHVERGRSDSIDAAYLERLWAGDWPLWRTCGDTMAKVRESIASLLNGDAAARVIRSLEALEDVHTAGRHSVLWQIRAKVGRRIRWYELPEDFGAKHYPEVET